MTEPLNPAGNQPLTAPPKPTDPRDTDKVLIEGTCGYCGETFARWMRPDDPPPQWCKPGHRTKAKERARTQRRTVGRLLEASGHFHPRDAEHHLSAAAARKCAEPWQEAMQCPACACWFPVPRSCGKSCPHPEKRAYRNKEAAIADNSRLVRATIDLDAYQCVGGTWHVGKDRRALDARIRRVTRRKAPR